MYARSNSEADAATASTFGVSGKLWNGVLVMFDRETKSLWTQLDGRAIEGERAGERLEHVPSEFTTWELWKRAHPQTLALEKAEDERERVGSRYADYFADPERLFLPELADGIGGVRAKDTVFGVVIDGEALAVTEELVAETGVVNAIVGGVPVAFLFDADTGFVHAVESRHGGQVLILAALPGEDPRELVRDVASGETRSIDELPSLRVDRAFWYAWSRSHPGSRILSR